MLKRAANTLLRYLAFALVALWSAVPVLFIVLSSLKRERDIFAYPPVLLFQPTFDHYVTLWQQWGGFFETLRNSLIVASGATLLAAFVSFLAGYAYSRYSSRLLAGSAFYMIAVRLLPPIVVTLPLFPLADFLGMSDSHALLIILYATFWVSLFTMIMKTFIDEVPVELDEAAYVDGASRWQTLTKVIFPLALQGMAAGSLFVFIYSWNEFLFALIFTTKHAKTAPLVISEVMGSVDGTAWGVLFAGVTVQLLPVVLLAGFAQRFLIAGLTAGSVKG
ncbi:carbohydrate ABC transporter permease [Ferrovibrio sp.]|uniref:carbohydrate ABC transporter permease n=1 Tax=Ferrovibrio sp. TaxID=1917215 RepID=UPI003D12F73B